MKYDEMQALVYTAPGKLELKRVPVPSIAEDEVLIRVKSCGICGSDVPGYLGRTGRRIPPMIMGHEFSGVIEEVGAKVSRYKPGQRVTVQPIRYCGTCEFCRSGKTSLCSNQSMLGVLETDGAMAEYVRAAERQIVPLPDEVSFDTGALAEPFAVAYSAVEKGDVTGKTVAVVGCGTIGLMIISALRLKGAAAIYAMDLAEDKRAYAKKIGADVVFDPRSEEDFQSMLTETGGGVEVAFEAVGATESVASAMRSLKKAGTAVWVGNMIAEIKVNMQQIVTRELQVKGNFDYRQEGFADAVRMMGKFDFSHLIDRVITLDQADLAFEQLGSKKINSIKTIIHLEGANENEKV